MNNIPCLNVRKFENYKKRVELVDNYDDILKTLSSLEHTQIYTYGILLISSCVFSVYSNFLFNFHMIYVSLHTPLSPIRHKSVSRVCIRITLPLFALLCTFLHFLYTFNNFLYHIVIKKEAFYNHHFLQRY